MVKVDAGPFLMGSTDQQIADVLRQDAMMTWITNEQPQHTLTLPAYWIGKTEVTNAQFRPFVEGDGYTNRAYWTEAGWAWQQAEKITQPAYWNDVTWNGSDYPVVGVSWFEAVAYCRWLSQKIGIDIRLPSEAEWEKAARGSDGRIYPWGNTWDAKRANSNESGLKKTTPVGSYPTGASPYGALDMAGNVWEWCATKWQKPYPYQLEDEWQATYLESNTDYRVLRGGSSWNDSTVVRGAFRFNDDLARDRYDDRGLRVASRSPLPGSGS
ncbi:MAG: formylglycine-generating enzyme family protein [Chloroflexales bacterium]